MARNTFPHSTNVSFPVAVEPLFTQDAKPSGLFGTVRRDDTGVHVFNALSERYGLLTNDSLINAIEDSMAKIGLTGFTREQFAYDAGARSQMVWTFKNRTIKVPKVGDEIAFRITARNSYDGTWRASLVDSVMRLACLNGMTRPQNEFSLAKKHTAGLSVDHIVAGLEGALQRFDSWAEDLSILNVKVTDVQGLNLLNRAEESGVISGKVREGITGFWTAPRRNEDSARTLLNLYNAGTEYLTHALGRERHQYSTQLNGRWTEHLLDLGRDKTALSTALTPLSSN